MFKTLRRFIPLALMCLALSGCAESCSTQTPVPTTGPVRVPSGADALSSFTRQKIPADFAFEVKDLRAVPGKTRLTEVVAALGQPSEDSGENSRIHDLLKGKQLWGAKVDTWRGLKFKLDGVDGVLQADFAVLPGTGDGVLFNIYWVGMAGPVKLGDGTRPGDMLDTLIARLDPHFQTALEMPLKIQDLANWNLSGKARPYFGRASKPKYLNPDGAGASGIRLEWNAFTEHEKAAGDDGAENPFGSIRGWWYVEATADPRAIGAVGVRMDIGPEVWFKTPKDMEENLWKQMASESRIKENLPIALAAPR